MKIFGKEKREKHVIDKEGRHGRGSNPRSSVYETDALPLGHRAAEPGIGENKVIISSWPFVI